MDIGQRFYANTKFDQHQRKEVKSPVLHVLQCSGFDSHNAHFDIKLNYCFKTP